MTEVRARALVDFRAESAAVLKPLCLVQHDVWLRPRVRLESHVVATGRTTLDAGCRMLPLARPHDLNYRGASTELVIGAGNQICQRVTMLPAVACGGGLRRDRSTEQDASARADLPAGH